MDERGRNNVKALKRKRQKQDKSTNEEDSQNKPEEMLITTRALENESSAEIDNIRKLIRDSVFNPGKTENRML